MVCPSSWRKINLFTPSPYLITLLFWQFSRYFGRLPCFQSCFIDWKEKFVLKLISYKLHNPQHQHLHHHHGQQPLKTSTGGPRYPRVCYLRFWLCAVSFLYPKFTIRGFSLNYSRILTQLASKTSLFWWKQCSLVIRGFGIRGTFQERNPRE